MVHHHVAAGTKRTGERLNRPALADGAIPPSNLLAGGAPGNPQRLDPLHESRKGYGEGRGVRGRPREHRQPTGTKPDPLEKLLRKVNLRQEPVEGGAAVALRLAGDQRDPSGAQFEWLENKVA